VTNLHYHGTHVSPQPHQDYVLLQLFSKDQTNPPPPDPNKPENTFSTAIGQYQTNIDPLPWNQAPGTHWYHPHKHGSTSVQVLNGMAGALIITGPFDGWLHGLYDGKLVDRVLVVQQIGSELNFFSRGLPHYPPQALVNGYATPKITMKRGEIQRWRFIGATMQRAMQRLLRQHGLHGREGEQHQRQNFSSHTANKAQPYSNRWWRRGGS
jgi:FtsP/CotA-like multicopper oxidase with cupredoxin domain